MRLVVITDSDDEYEACDNLEEVIKQSPEAVVAIINSAINKAIEASYKEDFGDDKVCKCGHVYYRHFDTYEHMKPVGCKYCPCQVFELKDA